MPSHVFLNKGIGMSELEIGDRAPPFDLAVGPDTRLSLADLAGRPVVLYFYPQDDTKSCTVEAIDFSRLGPAFERAGAKVIGVSPDSLARHDRFRAKHQLGMALAADEQRNAIEAYGVWAEKQLYGRKYMGVVRSTFLIAADGRIARIWRNVRVRNHAEEVLAAVQAL